MKNSSTIMFLTRATCLMAGVSLSQAAVIAHYQFNEGTAGQNISAISAPESIDGDGGVWDNIDANSNSSGGYTGTANTWVNDPDRGIVINSGVGAYLTPSSTANFDRTTGWTASAFINQNSDSPGGDILMGTRGGTYFRIYDNTMDGNYLGGGSPYLGGSPTPRYGSWNHYAVVGDSSSIRVYRNGALQSSDATTATDIYSGAWRLTGDRTDWGEESDSRFSDFSVWDEALTQSEVTMMSEFGSHANGFMYDAQEMVSLFDWVEASGAGGPLTIGSDTWYVRNDTDATGTPDQLYPSAGANFYYNSSNGFTFADAKFRVLTPEPTTSLLSIFGLIMVRGFNQRLRVANLS